jgi:hypothetical protein
MLLGAALAPIAGWTVGMLAVAAGALLAWRALVVARRGRAVQLHNAALERAMRGEVEEAEALLDQISPAMRRWGHLARAGGFLRALIAFYRGDTQLAVSLTTPAIAVPYSRLDIGLRSLEQMHRAQLLALRGLAYASLGEAALAEADAAASESAPGAGPDVLARAALARAIMTARREGMEGLAPHLAQTNALMLEYLPPRERMLVRALRRMARTRPASIYREAAKRDDEATEEGRLAAWIGKLAPGAEAFVSHDGGAAAGPATAAEARSAPASPEALRDVQRARRLAQKTAGSRGGTRAALVSMAVVIACVTTWQLFAPPSPGHAAVAWWPPAAAVTIFFVVFIAFLMRRIASMRDATRQLVASQVELARGKTTVAVEALERLTRSSQDAAAAGAHLSMARLAEQQSRWAEAVDHSSRGIARLSKSSLMKAASSDALLPELLVTRAFALVASGRQAEADVEMAVMRAECPNYLQTARASFRVALLSALRAGDLARAAEIARGRAPELPLSLRDEMLADVVLAATSVMSKDERERIDGELDDDSALRAWIDDAAPGLRETSRTRVGTSAAAEASVVHEEEEVAIHEDARLGVTN